MFCGDVRRDYFHLVNQSKKVHFVTEQASCRDPPPVVPSCAMHLLPDGDSPVRLIGVDWRAFAWRSAQLG